MVLPPITQKPVPTPSPAALQKVESKEMQMIDTDVSAFYDLIVNGNIAKLTQDQKVVYYNKVCDSLGLNPVTRPLAFIELQGKLTLYALKEAAAQLSRKHSVSCEILKVEVDKASGMAYCDVRAKDPSGRFTDETGAVAWGDKLAGDNAANQRMKLVTKAKRRAILSHCGLGMLDEAEIETVPGAKEPAPEKTVRAAKPIEITAQKTQETAPAVSEPPVTAPAVNAPDQQTKMLAKAAEERLKEALNKPLPTTTDDAPFNYATPEDRQWLIEQVKSTFPGIVRENIIQLCGTFQKHELRRTVTDILQKRLAHEKAALAEGRPSIIGRA